MHATMFESLRHGFTGGTLTLEALLLIKTIKAGAVALFLIGIHRELTRFLR
jgi:hypothetical protein